jgi:protocatechuate 3,4-dioxygenase beta subunit
MSRPALLTALLCHLSSASFAQTPITGNEPIVVDCEGCAAAFEGVPQDLSSTARLSPPSEPGARLQLSGTVYNGKGHPQADIVLYAYQTNSTGVYPPNAALSGDAADHGLLRGWVVSDDDGHYNFQTIRPGSYPNTSIAQHIHLHVIEPNRCTYYLGDVLFDDDPLLDPAERKAQEKAYGGSGIVQMTGDEENGWQATRDIWLGKNIATYAQCGN